MLPQPGWLTESKHTTLAAQLYCQHGASCASSEHFIAAVLTDAATPLHREGDIASATMHHVELSPCDSPDMTARRSRSSCAFCSSLS